MSNYALQAELSRLQAELARVERINRELIAELGTIVAGVVAAHRQLEDYNSYIQNTLVEGNNRMRYSHQRTVDALAMQGEIERIYARFKQIELANKKIRECNNKKYYDFGNYRAVRKIVQALMDNLDVKMVSDAAIYKSVEKAHLQSPDYWLTCVLISIMAWRNDDRLLADRSMELALSMDKKSSAVFYMLFNIRMHRESAALKWFTLFTECEITGADQRTMLLMFSLIAKTLNDDIDDETRNEVSAFIRKMLKDNVEASFYNEEYIVEYIISYFRRMVRYDQMNLTMLNRYCTEINTLVDLMMRARSNEDILEFMVKTLNVTEAERNTFIKDFIDELIAAPNQVEKDVYDEIELNEAIIRFEGDAESARAYFEKNRLRKKVEINLIEEMIRWIYDKDEDVADQLRANMLRLTSDYNERAVKQFAEEYRSRYKHNYQCTIDDYTADVDFTREEEELNNIAAFNRSKMMNEKAKIKSWPAIVGFVVGAAAAAGAVFSSTYLLFIVTALGVGFGIFSLVGNSKQIKLLESKCDEDTRSMQDTMRAIFADFRKYDEEYRHYDSYNERIIEELAKE